MADTTNTDESDGLSTVTLGALGALGVLGALAFFRGRDKDDDDRDHEHKQSDAPPAPPAPRPVATPAPRTHYVGPTEPLARTYDPIFAREGQGLPVAFLRSLAAHESDLRPDVATGPAWGLLQVIEVVRRDYNTRHGTTYDRQSLLDPAINVRIAVDALSFIVESYRTHHASVNLHEDWQNPRFVELLALGWNAGFSEEAGVGRVARFLENTNTAVTLDSVTKAASAVGASKYLSNPMRISYARGVAATYQRERDRDASEGYAVGPTGSTIHVEHPGAPPAPPAEPPPASDKPQPAPSTTDNHDSTNAPSADATHDMLHLIDQIPMVAMALPDVAPAGG